jgi:hypothetical protein
MEVLPPLLPDLASQLESYLLHPELLPIHDTGPAQQFWSRQPNPLALLQPPASAPLEHQLRVVRDPRSGRVTGFEEVTLSAAEAGTTARNSTSLRRAPGPPEETTRGSASNYPFWPGGFDLPAEVDQPAEGELLDAGDDTDELIFAPATLLHCPPGFDAGIDFYRLAQEEAATPASGGNLPPPHPEQEQEEQSKKVESVLNLASALYEDNDILEGWREAEAGDSKTAGTARILTDVDKLVPEDQGDRNNNC